MFERVRKSAASALDLADLMPDILLSRLGLDRRARYLFEHVSAVLQAIETDAAVDSCGAALRRLAKLGLDDFGYVLWSMPDVRFPKLSRLLPPMASAEVQRHWTGRSGIALLKPSVNFVRILAYNYTRLTGAALDERTRILDYGCGYGRIARLMYYFTTQSNVVGVDPWEKSIELCRLAGLGPNFLQSAYVPETLPVGGARFDLIYAYSVFTHLAEPVARAALGALRRCIKDDGILALTIRPVEYWDLARYISRRDADALTAEHRAQGFAFHPHTSDHEHNAIAAGLVYGDTSIAERWFDEHCDRWSVELVDRSLNDRLQTYLYLRPR